MTVYLGRERDSALRNTWLQLARQCHNWQRKYKDVATNCTWTITSPPKIYSMTWLRSKFTVVALSYPIRRACHRTWTPKIMTLKMGDLQVPSRGDLITILWRDKCDVRILTNIHDAPAEGNFCDTNGKAIKPKTVVDCNRHLGYVDKGDRMANSYSINRCTWKWTKTLFFHLFDLAILNSYILFSSLGGKEISHRDFRNTLIRNLLAQAGHERNVQRPVGRPPAAALQIIRFQERSRKQWPIPSVTRRRCMCAEKGVARNVSMICERCSVGLCCNNTCFRDYHT
jgi:hypothetical protein